jgi:hypothetical protein
MKKTTDMLVGGHERGFDFKDLILAIAEADFLVGHWTIGNYCSPSFSTPAIASLATLWLAFCNLV